jgi:hypothetical protein
MHEQRIHEQRIHEQHHTDSAGDIVSQRQPSAAIATDRTDRTIELKIRWIGALHETATTLRMQHGGSTVDDTRVSWSRHRRHADERMHSVMSTSSQRTLHARFTKTRGN